jgi:hypothetical protein
MKEYLKWLAYYIFHSIMRNEKISTLAKIQRRF